VNALAVGLLVGTFSVISVDKLGSPYNVLRVSGYGLRV